MMPAKMKLKSRSKGPVLEKGFTNAMRSTSKTPVTKVNRRLSVRLQNQDQMGMNGKAIIDNQIDSAYDGDGESSPGTTQSEGDDPYSISSIEDVPVVAKKTFRKKKVKAKTGTKTSKVNTNKEITTNRPNKRPSTGASDVPSKRPSTGSAHTSSTPNLPVHTRTRSKGRVLLNLTPEVTPILPSNPTNVSENKQFSTPHIYQTRRLRSSPNITSPSTPDIISPSMLSSSQADSGIAVSPPAKRPCVQACEPRHRSAAKQGKKFMNKRNIFSPNAKQASKQCEALKENVELEDSAFGFNSPDKDFKDGSSPLIEINTQLPAAESYRSMKPTVMSDSSPSPSGHLASSDSDNFPQSSNQYVWPSPGLFSDDIFSADSESLTVNRSIDKTYKQVKVKKFKPKKSTVSKFEAWANEKNMEIEDIEKFDLNIE